MSTLLTFGVVPGCDGKHYVHTLFQPHAREVGQYALTPEEVVVLFGTPTRKICGRPWGTARDPQPVVNRDHRTGAVWA